MKNEEKREDYFLYLRSRKALFEQLFKLKNGRNPKSFEEYFSFISSLLWEKEKENSQIIDKIIKHFGYF